MLSLIDKLIGRKKKDELICQYCKEDTKKYPAHVIVQGTIIRNTKAPNVFLCPEQAFNFSQGIIVHDYCWIKMLREYGSPIYDLEKVRKKYNKLRKVK